MENGCISKTSSLLVGPFHFHHHGRVTSPIFLTSTVLPTLTFGHPGVKGSSSTVSSSAEPEVSPNKRGRELGVNHTYTYPKTLWESDYFRYDFCWGVNHIFSGGVWVSRGRKQNIRAETGSWWLGMIRTWNVQRFRANFPRWNGWDVKEWWKDANGFMHANEYSNPPKLWIEYLYNYMYLKFMGVNVGKYSNWFATPLVFFILFLNESRHFYIIKILKRLPPGNFRHFRCVSYAVQERIAVHRGDIVVGIHSDIAKPWAKQRVLPYYGRIRCFSVEWRVSCSPKSWKMNYEEKKRIW